LQKTEDLPYSIDHVLKARISGTVIARRVGFTFSRMSRFIPVWRMASKLTQLGAGVKTPFRGRHDTTCSWIVFIGFSCRWLALLQCGYNRLFPLQKRTYKPVILAWI
jgi:hypothetical protein